MSKEQLIAEIVRILESEPATTAKMIYHVLLGFMGEKHRAA